MNKFLSFYEKNNHLPGPLFRKMNDESGTKQKNTTFSSLFAEEQTLPYADRSLADINVFSLPAPLYDISEMTDEWMVSTETKIEKCACGAPPKKTNV